LDIWSRRAKEVLGVSEQVSTSVALDDRLEDFALLLDLVRTRRAQTRADLVRRSGMSRKVLSQRLSDLLARGLVTEGDLAPSTGGRAPRELRFEAGAGRVLVAQFGATRVGAGIADLSGRVLHSCSEALNIGIGPDQALARVERLFDQLLGDRANIDPPVWGIGVGVPGPVEFGSGRPVAPPIMPGWDGYPIRERLADRFAVPAWVDNDVNLMALGELRAGLARGQTNVIYVKIGTGIGAGVISHGQLHRGAQGAAGDVGHVAIRADVGQVCRCGNQDCLEAHAGGAALVRDAVAAGQDGRSPFFAGRLGNGGTLTTRDLADAAVAGDAVANSLLTRSGRLVGETLATLVNFFNPSTIVIGGGVAATSDVVLASVRQAVYQQSLPLATRNLHIAQSVNNEQIGLVGAAYMVVDELFDAPVLARWIGSGSPAGRPDLSQAA
jgi:glucokinase-like ROK family protein